MADGASLPHRLVLINKGAPLLRMTFEAGFVTAHESKAAGSELLLHVCRRALRRDPFVRFMTITAAHLAFQHRMVMRQRECCPNLQVTLETGVGRFARVDDCARSAAGFDVQTPRSMAGLTAHILGVFTFRLQPRMRGCPEVAHDLFVAGRAFL